MDNFEPLQEYYVGTLGALLERMPPDKLFCVSCESFFIYGFRYELEKLLRAYRSNSVFAVKGLDGFYRL